MAKEPRANMLVFFESCKDVVKYVAEDNASILGLDKSFFDLCKDSLAELEEEVVIMPRRIITIDRKSIGIITMHRKLDALTAFKPLDTQSARVLAKIRKSTVLLVSPNSLKYVNEAQVNFLKQSHSRKFLEIAFGEFVKLLALNSRSMHASKAFYSLGNTMEKALKLDIGVAASGAIENYPKCLFTNHIDALLFSMGFSKRERRMILEVYPLELLKVWLGEE